MYVEPLNITVVIMVIEISYPFPFLLQPCIRSILHSASNALSRMQRFDFKEKALNQVFRHVIQLLILGLAELRFC